jgi:hypothetical protein
MDLAQANRYTASKFSSVNKKKATAKTVASVLLADEFTAILL